AAAPPQCGAAFDREAEVAGAEGVCQLDPAVPTEDEVAVPVQGGERVGGLGRAHAELFGDPVARYDAALLGELPVEPDAQFIEIDDGGPPRCRLFMMPPRRAFPHDWGLGPGTWRLSSPDLLRLAARSRSSRHDHAAPATHSARLR